MTADPAITAVLDKWTPLAEAHGNEPVGTITETITRGGDPTGDDRGVESAAGNLVADAQLAATEGLGRADRVHEPGRCPQRPDFPESAAGEGDGVVTFGEAFTFQPFNNTMFVLPMTGEQILGARGAVPTGRQQSPRVAPRCPRRLHLRPRHHPAG